MARFILVRFVHTGWRLAVAALTIFLLAGCTNKEVYNAIQQNRISECNKEPILSLQEKCKQDYQKSYDDYKKDQE